MNSSIHNAIVKSQLSIVSNNKSTLIAQSRQEQVFLSYMNTNENSFAQNFAIALQSFNCFLRSPFQINHTSAKSTTLNVAYKISNSV